MVVLPCQSTTTLKHVGVLFPEVLTVPAQCHRRPCAAFSTQITPSAFSLIAPGGGLLGVAVRCPACSAVSVNLVTAEHLDVPLDFESVGAAG